MIKLVGVTKVSLPIGSLLRLLGNLNRLEMLTTCLPWLWQGNRTTYLNFFCFAKIFFVANTFQIQPFHKGLAMQADEAFCFMTGA
jgi:hypothetical protein